jgi:hypothetical protein
METKENLVDVKNELTDMIGFNAPAEISMQGAMRSAGILVEIEERMISKNASPMDLLSASISTSQLLNWWEQRDQLVASGKLQTIEDTETISQIAEKFTQGNLPKEEIKHLTKLLYVANPRIGANKGMQMLRDLKMIFPAVDIKAK